MNYVLPTAEEIESIAEQYFEANKVSDKDSIEENISKNINAQKVKTENVLQSALADKLKIDSQKEEDVKQSQYNSIKKGISNSSIVDGIEDMIQTIAKTKTENLNTDTSNSIREIEEQIEFLNQLKTQKLESLEEEYGNKVASKIYDLNQKELQKQQSVDKYNNSVDEKETKYQQSLKKQQEENEKEEWSRVAKMLELKEKIGESGVAKQKQEEKYASAKALLDEMNPSEAYDLLTSNSSMKTHLGDFYDTLLVYFKNKK